MRVFVIASAPGGGLLYHPTRMAVGLKAMGNDVHVATWGEKAQTPELRGALSDAGIPVHQFECLANSRTQALLRSNRELKKCIADLQPDAVHVFGAVSAFQAYVPGAGRPRIVAMIEAMAHGSKSLLPARMGALLLNRYADKVFALCQAEKGRLSAAGVRPEKLGVIYNPLDCDDFLRKAALNGRGRDALLAQYGIPTDRKLLGYFANFQPRKRHDLLIRAFAALSPQFPEWTLVLGGSGNELDPCRALARELGVESRVVFPGRIPNADLAPVLASVDAVAHCSNAETFGYSMVEPLLLAKPTVMTRVAFAHEIEQAGHAVVVAPDNLDELRRGLERVMAPDADTLARVASAPEFVRRNLDVGVVMSRLMKVYVG